MYFMLARIGITFEYGMNIGKATDATDFTDEPISLDGYTPQKLDRLEAEIKSTHALIFDLIALINCQLDLLDVLLIPLRK
jgi:hypothetical protein